MSITINSINYKIIKDLCKVKKIGMNIYQVLNEKDNKYYVIKEISIKDEKKEIINDIQKEADILSKFKSDRIVKYYGSSKDKNNFYILMEYCEGNDLRYFIDEQKKNHPNQLLEEHIIYNIIKQLSAGIKEIHDNKIVHRDLKPENIFMNKNMEIKIGGFGVSKELNSYKKYYSTINKSGTFNYTAPEIIKYGKYNEKADIWALGCIIYEIFTLRIYFEDKFSEDIQNINSDCYNTKWQSLIDSLLQIDDQNRPNIYEIIGQINKIEINRISNDKLGINTKIFNYNENIIIPKIIRRLEHSELKNLKFDKTNTIKSKI